MRAPWTEPGEPIAKALRVATAAYNAYDTTPNLSLSERRKLRCQMDLAYAHVTALQADCREAFAKQRGWRYDPKKWTHGFEHAQSSNGNFVARIVKSPEFFRDKDGRIVGLVTHTQVSTEEMARYAARNGYEAELLPFSWLDPRTHNAVLLTLKAGAKWP